MQRQHRRSLGLHRLQGVGIEAEQLEDRRSDLRRLDRCADGVLCPAVAEWRAADHQGDVAVPRVVPPCSAIFPCLPVYTEPWRAMPTTSGTLASPAGTPDKAAASAPA